MTDTLSVTVAGPGEREFAHLLIENLGERRGGGLTEMFQTFDRAAAVGDGFALREHAGTQVYLRASPPAPTPPPSLPELCREIHSSNVTAGWWTDLTTGASTLETRNRPEMLMLAVSELAEAADGAMGEPDDKLPHLPMYDVELADFVIRQLDQIGAEARRDSAVFERLDWNDPRAGEPYGIGFMRAASRPERLMVLVQAVARAMEYYRKGRTVDYVAAMLEGVQIAFRIAEIEHIDLFDIIAQKRAFNATRADHQVENRRREGGKAF